MNTPAGGPLGLLPELLLLIGAVVALMTGSFSPRDRQWPARAVAVVALLGSFAAAVVAHGDRGTIYQHSWAVDAATEGARLIVPLAALLVLSLSVDAVRGAERETELSVLVLLASLGALVLAGASDLLILAVGYLLASIPLYALAGWGRDARGAEAALKLYLLGALLGIVLMLGVAVLTGVSGGGSTYADLAAGLPGAPKAAVALGVLAVLAGLLFKIGGVPAHFWVPDAAEGSTVSAAAFLTTVPKIGGLIAAYRLLDVVPDRIIDWRLLVALIAAATMTLGNLAAFAQDSPTRLLGWSTVAQAGYLLMAVVVAGLAPDALPALLAYLAAYAVTNVAAFAVVAALPVRASTERRLPGRRPSEPQNLDDYTGLARRHPWLAATLVVSLLGLVGTPPTAVFAGKLTVFAATWDGGYGWLVAIAAANTVASLFYYLRWLAPVFRRPAGEPVSRPASVDPAPPWAASTAVLCGVAVLVVGLASGPLLAVLGGSLTR